jgi:hypothetical protein
MSSCSSNALLIEGLRNWSLKLFEAQGEGELLYHLDSVHLYTTHMEAKVVDHWSHYAA